MRWNYLSIPKLQRLHRWSLGMDKLFHPILYNGCDYISMLGLKLNHVSKRGHRNRVSKRVDTCVSYNFTSKVSPQICITHLILQSHQLLIKAKFSVLMFFINIGINSLNSAKCWNGIIICIWAVYYILNHIFVLLLNLYACLFTLQPAISSPSLMDI